MRDRRQTSSNSFYESFSDVAFLMLATFIFLLVTILITSRIAEQYQVPKLQKELASSQAKLKKSLGEKERLTTELGELMGTATDTQINKILSQAGLGKKDFELFVKGLRDIPGKDVHLIVDATGSMHGAAVFLVPVLRAIVIRSGKSLSATTWFSDGEADSYFGNMGYIFDQLMQGAPFIGSNETIGRAFTQAIKAAPKPGAYILIGDEPSDDVIHYSEIPSPVFSLALGSSDPSTIREYSILSEKTGGKLLHMKFQ
jgi:hypothetical protein